MAKPNITVCICTYRRPQMLEQLLRAIGQQRTNDLFDVSAVVVDNDSEQSAKACVAQVAGDLRVAIQYHLEPEKNIALARNRAVINATGDYIATIDDDEVPVTEWLLRMFLALEKYQADGVLGPVHPSFPPEAPRWLKRSGLCDRESYPTGTRLTTNHPLRTGNTLLSRNIFRDGTNLFRAEFGQTGGEDGDFFDRCLKFGYTFVWCHEAPAFEHVPPDRWELSFYLRKAMRIGALMGLKIREGTVPRFKKFAFSTLVTFAFLPVLPLLALLGRSFVSKYLAKYLYHFSRVAATLGLPLFVER